LKQLANLIGRTNIPQVVKNDFAAAHDFFSLVLDAHIVAAAMNFFNMKQVCDVPRENAFPGNLSAAKDEEKKKYLSLCTRAFISKFALHHVQSLDDDSTTCTDGVFEYACSVVGFGLLARNFSDATHEGDGERLIRCWKFFMLHFKADGRTKYAVEAFNLLAQVKATLTPQMAHRLVWNRTCNPKGGEGKNVQLDLHNEHLNRVFKDDINTFRVNISPTSVSRSSQAIGPMMDMLKAVDTTLHVKTPSGRHIGPNIKHDFQLILKVLSDEEVFLTKKNRKHKHFPNFQSDPFLPLKKKPKPYKKFHKWLIKRRKAASIQHQIATRVF